MNKRLDIIMAAMKLFTEKDIQATPMSIIAKEAKTGMGTIYNYFATKEELINAIYVHTKEEQVAAFKSLITDKGVHAQFDAFLEGMISYLMANPLHFYFTEQFKNSPLLTAESLEWIMKPYEPIMACISKGQKKGSIKPIPVIDIVYFIHGALNNFIRVSITDNKVKKKALENHLAMAWNAIAK